MKNSSTFLSAIVLLFASCPFITAQAQVQADPAAGNPPASLAPTPEITTTGYLPAATTTLDSSPAKSTGNTYIIYNATMVISQEQDATEFDIICSGPRPSDALVRCNNTWSLFTGPGSYEIPCDNTAVSVTINNAHLPQLDVNISLK